MRVQGMKAGVELYKAGSSLFCIVVMPTRFWKVPFIQFCNSAASKMG